MSNATPHYITCVFGPLVLPIPRLVITTLYIKRCLWCSGSTQSQTGCHHFTRGGVYDAVVLHNRRLVVTTSHVAVFMVQWFYTIADCLSPLYMWLCSWRSGSTQSQAGRQYSLLYFKQCSRQRHMVVIMVAVGHLLHKQKTSKSLQYFTVLSINHINFFNIHRSIILTVYLI